jgi:hypothetical protein
VKPRFPEHFTYMTLDVEDNEEQNLIRLFPAYVPHFLAISFTWLRSRCRAKEFINRAISGGGRVLVHCNGIVLSWLKTEGSLTHCGLCRRNQLVPVVCGNVRNATLPTIMGRRSAYGAEQTVLHLPERRFLDSDQGELHDSPRRPPKADRLTFPTHRNMKPSTKQTLLSRRILRHNG